MKPLDELLFCINKVKEARALFDLFPFNNFIRVDRLHSFNISQPAPVLVVYKVSRPIVGSEIVINLEDHVELPIGRIYYLLTSGFNFGYLLEFPSLDVLEGGSFFGVWRNPKRYYRNTKVVLSNPNLTILASDQDALLITGTNSQWVDRNGYYGRRGDNKE